MEEITIRGTRAQRNLMEWSRRVADCRSSGRAVRYSVQVFEASNAGIRNTAGRHRKATGSGGQRPNWERFPGGLRRSQRRNRLRAL